MGSGVSRHAERRNAMPSTTARSLVDMAKAFPDDLMWLRASHGREYVVAMPGDAEPRDHAAQLLALERRAYGITVRPWVDGPIGIAHATPGRPQPAKPLNGRPAGEAEVRNQGREKSCRHDTRSSSSNSQHIGGRCRLDSTARHSSPVPDENPKYAVCHADARTRSIQAALKRRQSIVALRGVSQQEAHVARHDDAWRGRKRATRVTLP